MTISRETPLVLGSASPRRREILTGLGIPFRALPADVVETVLPGEAPDAYLKRVVRDKLAAVAARVASAGGDGFAGILVADTSVIVDEAILGKPADVDEAEQLLGRIAGRAHFVLTRYAIARASAPDTPAVERTVRARVVMRAASRAELRRYAERGEGLDKAGAYAVQGLGAFLVERIEGSYGTVVGLPACELVQDLTDAGLLAQFP